MRTLAAYGIGVVIVLAVLNGIAWQAGAREQAFAAPVILEIDVGTHSATVSASPCFRQQGCQKICQHRRIASSCLWCCAYSFSA
jgi:hypothetical protein